MLSSQHLTLAQRLGPGSGARVGKPGSVVSKTLTPFHVATLGGRTGLFGVDKNVVV